MQDSCLFNATDQLRFASNTAADMDSSTGEDVLLGIVLVLVGEVNYKLFLYFNIFPLQFFYAAQWVYEEKYLRKYKISSLKVVGLEGNTHIIFAPFNIPGIYGALTLFVLLWPMYFIKIGKQFGLGPEYRYNMIDKIRGYFQNLSGLKTCWMG